MTDVLVVGAGPTGLTIACLLRASGLDVRIVDRLPAPTPLAKAMVVWSRSLEVLEGLDLAKAAVAAGIGLRHARYLDGDRLLASVRTDRIAGTRWQPLLLPQHTLERLLRQRLEALGVGVEWGRELTSATDAGDGVIATVAGDGGATERIPAVYVVGCDGLRSAVREAAGIAWRDYAPYEETFRLGDVEARTPLDRAAAHQFLGRSGVSVALPMPGDLWRIVGYRDGDDDPSPPDRHALQRLLDDVGHVGTTIGAVHWSGSFRVVRRLADSFRAGRLLLAGDAAHVHSPAGGQGLNTGIQDASNLAWKLTLVVRGLAQPPLLDSYTAERRPVAARILAMTELQDRRLFGARSPSSRIVRNGVLRIGDRTGILERRLIPDLAQVRLRYEDSPLTLAGDRRGARGFVPGRLVPDVALAAANGSGDVALRDLCRGAAITIVAAPGRDGAVAVPALERLVARYAGAVALRGPLSPLPGTGGWLIGVRPDGYIGYRGPCAVTPSLCRWIGAVLTSPVAAADRTRHIALAS